jgi:hypothetical protein
LSLQWLSLILLLLMERESPPCTWV